MVVSRPLSRRRLRLEHTSNRTPGRSLPGVFFLFLLALPTWAASAAPAATRLPDLLLVTLDTVRADALGAYGGGARTPTLDALAAAGVRFDEALTAAPLTLPAHVTLFTGLDPIEHGLRDNGAGALAPGIPTLAEALRARGYATVGVIASRVLDRRFGLDRGFDLYDETMAAERLGEYGYPERSAADVVDAALAGERAADPARPHFLWVHFYDAHAPYRALAGNPGASDRERYLGEIESVDRELGRLLAALASGPRAAQPRLVAVVGDHGESLGEHGEKEHGLLLSRAALRVPLLIAGPGVPQGRNLEAPIATRRLASTLLSLVDASGNRLDSGARSKGPVKGVGGPPLSLVPGAVDGEAIYHETLFPFSAFGWAPLFAVTEGHLRFVLGPRPQLLDWMADSAELQNAFPARASAARKLQKDLKSLLYRKPLSAPTAVAPDAQLAATLQNLGYLSGQSASAEASAAGGRGKLDPAAGLVLLERFAAGKRLFAAGDLAGALTVYTQLTVESPGSVPFWMERGAAERGLGRFGDAVTSLERAQRLNPQLDFLDLRLGEAYAAAGRGAEAEAAWRRALARNPRFAQAVLALGEFLERSGRAADEEAVVRAAVEAGTTSAFLLTRLAQIELQRGDVAGADGHLAEATRLLPEFSTAWKLWAEVARRQNDPAAAAERAARAAALQ